MADFPTLTLEEFEARHGEIIAKLTRDNAEHNLKRLAPELRELVAETYRLIGPGLTEDMAVDHMRTLASQLEVVADLVEEL